MSEATIIDGKAFALSVRQTVAAKVARLKADHGITPGLAVVLVGEDPASQVYVRSKGKSTVEAGMESFEFRMDAGAGHDEVLAKVNELNADDRVNGILVQLPLPSQVDEAAIINAIDPAKDVDGFHVINTGRLSTGQDAMVPCTPLGCQMMLRDHLGKKLEGAEAVIVGRSNIVGKPMAQLLLQDNCTVTIAHSRTRDLPAVVRRADVVVAAVGRPEMVSGDWIKPGATVIDVGINRIETRRQDAAGRRCLLRGGGQGGRRDHTGAGRRRAHDDRLPAGQHGDRRLPPARRARAGGLMPMFTRPDLPARLCEPSVAGRDAVRGHRRGRPRTAQTEASAPARSAEVATKPKPPRMFHRVACVQKSGELVAQQSSSRTQS